MPKVKMKLFLLFYQIVQNNSLNAQRIHGTSLPLWIFDENTKYETVIWRQHGRRVISSRKAPVTTIVPTVSEDYCVQTVTDILYKLSNRQPQEPHCPSHQAS